MRKSANVNLFGKVTIIHDNQTERRNTNIDIDTLLWLLSIFIVVVRWLLLLAKNI